MVLKNLIDVDFVNYKIPSMTLGFPTCTFKCEKECGYPICQNRELINTHDVEISVNDLVHRYLDNSTAHAICMQGMEPLDSWDDVLDFITNLRKYSDDDIVIYTGYTKCEIQDYVKELQRFKNIIIKYGRFVPNQKPHYDSVLGVNLASDNQYAEVIS